MKIYTNITRVFLFLAGISISLSGVMPVRAQAPSNDELNGATEALWLPYSDSIDTSYATEAWDDPRPCGYTPFNSVWYKYTASSDMRLTVSTLGSDYQTAVGVYAEVAGMLEEKTCATDNPEITVQVNAGETLYFIVVDMRIGEPYPVPGEGGGGYLQFNLSEVLVNPPVNDDFADAQPISSLPFSTTGNIELATLEEGEIIPGCVWDQVYRSVWFRFEPAQTQVLQTNLNGNFEVVTQVLKGSDFRNLEVVACAEFGNLATFLATAGQVYYIQVSSMLDWTWSSWDYYLTLDLAPPVEVNIEYWPSFPSIFDEVSFCSSVYMDESTVDYWWLFPGEEAERTGRCQNYRFQADGDYLVQHRIRLADSREASTSSTVQVRTHDVSIVKVSVPNTARVDQTKEVSFEVRNTRYPERVAADLYKSTPYGYEWVGFSILYVPSRANGRTTEFAFKYTFTSQDAQIGKVTFKVQLNLLDANDALPADNEYISLPVRVMR